MNDVSLSVLKPADYYQKKEIRHGEGKLSSACSHQTGLYIKAQQLIKLSCVQCCTNPTEFGVFTRTGVRDASQSASI